VANPGRWVANVFWEVGDRGIIDGAADGLARVMGGFGRFLRRMETGYARRYALAMVVGVVIVIAVLAIR
jgi:NADH-quinone oxidoreductase subunit L